jgi:hypothetical protein
LKYLDKYPSLSNLFRERVKITPTPKEYYEDNGYYIFPKLIPDNVIDNLLEKYKAEILSSNEDFAS